MFNKFLHFCKLLSVLVLVFIFDITILISIINVFRSFFIPYFSQFNSFLLSGLAGLIVNVYIAYRHRLRHFLIQHKEEL